MLVDYKFVNIVRTNRKTKCLVRFYSGDVVSEKEMNDNHQVENVTRYRRRQVLETKQYSFDEVLTDEQLAEKINNELKLKGTEIPEQKNA